MKSHDLLNKLFKRVNGCPQHQPDLFNNVYMDRSVYDSNLLNSSRFRVRLMELIKNNTLSLSCLTRIPRESINSKNIQKF